VPLGFIAGSLLGEDATWRLHLQIEERHLTGCQASIEVMAANVLRLVREDAEVARCVVAPVTVEVMDDFTVT
jgi:hypothetical protein